MRRATSNGTNDNAPNVNRVALKNNGDMESMPWTCETNASPQINAVNIRQPMPAISFFCISHHRKRNCRERKRSDRNTVRPNYCTITRYLPNNLPARRLFRSSTRKACSEETAQKTRNACVLKAHNTKAYRHTSSVAQRRDRTKNTQRVRPQGAQHEGVSTYVECCATKRTLRCVFFTRGCREAEEYTRTCSRSRDTGSGRRGWRSS